MTALNPVLISVPHSGIQFPEEIKSTYKSEFLSHPKDTDWFVDQLYSFAAELSIEVVVAPYSRYVIDLNRNPEGQALYGDGRNETTLIPRTTFEGESLFSKDPPTQEECQRRLSEYYWPYYKNLEEKLSDRVKSFGQALLFDAHSIKRQVSSIRLEAFPDMILGSADDSSASPEIIKLARKVLDNGPYEVTYNHPFKGGHITRYFGKPKNNIHALQLEMSQDIYMNEETTVYDSKKAQKVQILLRKLFSELLVSLDRNENL
jgi:N-formylglutamate deformylase